MASPHDPRPTGDITTWFINAKRSLTSVSLCTRANDLVDAARMALQEATVIASRCVFLRRALQDQLSVVVQINGVMHTSREVARREFQSTLKELDAADTRLNEILSLLQETTVDPAFSPDTDEKRTLHDFVDDEGIENLRTQLRYSIDQVQESENNLASALQSFDAELESLQNAVYNLPTPTSSMSLPPATSLSPLLHSLEEHASVMASLLESLARHYDQCSLALKQTESSNHLGVNSESTGANSTLLSSTERAEMMEVLERDAAEVDDVVNEIKERLGEMEVTANAIQRFISDLDVGYRDTVDNFSTMEQFRGNILSCIARTKDFQLQQADYQTSIKDRLSELHRLAEHYILFANAYDALIVEVGRRLGMQKRKEKIIAEALAKIQTLNEEDTLDRESFKTDYGEYLPFDIWPGLSNPTVSYTATPIEFFELPSLQKHVIEKALTRRAGGALFPHR